MNLLKAGQKLSIPDADAVRYDRSGRGAPDLQRACRSLRQIPLAPGRGGERESHRGQGAERRVRHCQSFRRYGRRFRRVRPGPPAPVQRTGRRPGASRRPGRCQGVRRTRDGRCAGAGDYVAGQRGRVEQGGGRAGARQDRPVRRALAVLRDRRVLPALRARRAPLALRVLRARRGPLGRLDLAVRQARPVPRDPPPRRVVLAPPDRLARPARQALPDRPQQRAPPGRQERRARQAPRVRVLLRERRASRVLRLPSAPLRVRPRPPLPALRHQKARALRTRSRPICWPARRPG